MSINLPCVEARKFYMSDGMTAFNSLFWNTNDCNAKFTIFLQATFLCETDVAIKIYYFRTATTTAENLWHFRNRFSLILEQILAFASSPDMGRQIKYLPPNFKQVARQYFKLLNILIWIVRSIFSLNSKQFHQKLYSNSLDIVDWYSLPLLINKPGTCYFFQPF